jgi:hypothetical protein
MYSKQELCQRIQELNPDIGECGVDFDVEYDEQAEAWAVDFHDGRYHLKTFVDNQDAAVCLEKDMCIPLGVEVGQLRYNFNKYIHEHALEDV